MANEKLLLAIRLLFNCNVLQLDYAYFGKIEEGKIVNLFTCVWAVSYFSLVEYLILEGRFKINEKLMVMFIDDALIVWENLKK